MQQAVRFGLADGEAVAIAEVAEPYPKREFLLGPSSTAADGMTPGNGVYKPWSGGTTGPYHKSYTAN